MNVLEGIADSYEEIHYLIGGIGISAIVFSGVLIYQSKKYLKIIEKLVDRKKDE